MSRHSGKNIILPRFQKNIKLKTVKNTLYDGTLFAGVSVYKEFFYGNSYKDRFGA